MLFVECGPWAGGAFKFRLTLPEAYPADGATPAVRFYTRMFHPLVQPRGSAAAAAAAAGRGPPAYELDVRALLDGGGEWRAEAHSLAWLLARLKEAFLRPQYYANPELPASDTEALAL